MTKTSQFRQNTPATVTAFRAACLDEHDCEPKSLALIADDPDAPTGTWVHWVVFNLPTTVTTLAEDTPRTDSLSNGAKQGVNGFKSTGYAGPRPPIGTHRYFFKLYALDAMLDLKSGATKAELLKAMKGRIFAQGQLMGTYQRNCRQFSKSPQET